MLPFFASPREGEWAEKNILHHQGGGEKKIFREKNEDPIAPHPNPLIVNGP